MSMVLEMILPDRRIEIHGLVSVVFQSGDGEIGILGGHAPLICEVRAGTLCAMQGHDRRQRFVTGQGLARIDKDRVCLLLMDLIEEDQIDEAAARRQLQRARAEAALHPADGDDYEQQVRFAEAQLALVRNGGT
jgi:F-type H+-transporting ATPase subunit epsilon